MFQQKAKRVHMQTDLLCVSHWILEPLTGKARIQTKAASEMLIRRRLDMIKKIVAEYGLSVEITLVALECNFADSLT